MIAAAGGKKDLLNKSLTKDFENILENRMLVKENTKGIRITDIDTERNSKIIQPIICEGDVIGAVVVMGKDEAAKLSETEVKIAAIAANFLGRQMEA